MMMVTAVMLKEMSFVVCDIFINHFAGGWIKYPKIYPPVINILNNNKLNYSNL